MRLLHSLLVLPVFLGTLHAQGESTGRADDAPQFAPGLTHSQTQGLAVRYERSKHWALRGFLLLSLGPRWHPDGSAMVLHGLQSKEKELRIYALESLLRTEPAALRTIATPELVAELCKEQAGEKHEVYAAKVADVLFRIFPDAEVERAADWSRVWRAQHETWALEPWIPPPAPKGGGRTTSMGHVDRAFDLYEAGLDLCICLDTTGSMQPTIDAARDSIDDLVVLLRGISPKFRMGLVEYKDFGDYSDGAKVLEPLSKHPDRVKKRLERTVAAGGGDYPEAVEAGLEVALDQKFGWDRGTNKLIVVFGDAPPKDIDVAVRLARDAREKPFGVDPTDLTQKKRGRTRTITRPFVVAAVGVGAAGVPSVTERAFMRIAQAGGGAYARLLTQPLAGRGESVPPSEALARHVLTLAFGSQWANQVEAFVGVYMAYHRNGYLK